MLTLAGFNPNIDPSLKTYNVDNQSRRVFVVTFLPSVFEFNTIVNSSFLYRKLLLYFFCFQFVSYTVRSACILSNRRACEFLFYCYFFFVFFKRNPHDKIGPRNRRTGNHRLTAIMLTLDIRVAV